MKPNPEISETTPPDNQPTRKQAAPKAPNFDTMEAVGRLKRASFEDKQAVTLVETIQDAQVLLATRDDLVRTELALRSDMERMETSIRSDMERMEASIRSDMERMMAKTEAGIRNDMEGKFSDQRRFALVFGSLATGLLGALILLAK